MPPQRQLITIRFDRSCLPPLFRETPSMTKRPKSTTRPAQSIARRTFLTTTTAGAAAVTTGVWSEVPAKESTSPNQKLRILCVGTANRAAANISGVEGEEIVGLCDVDKEFLERAAAKHPRAATYADYREMIAKEAPGADAIVVATADHNHAPASLRGIDAGLHCYCEKPLTHTVEEARIIAAAAKSEGSRNPDGNADPRQRQLPACG